MNKRRPKESPKKPWPTLDAMSQVYKSHLWGGESVDFYSGNGSHDLLIINPYIQSVLELLESLPCNLTILDLGCGDFNVGWNLVPHCNAYIATDIVPELIDRNKKIFKADNLCFKTLDIAKDEWPAADVIILRQVLQHLSNAEIALIVNKLDNYPFLLLTEHVPAERFDKNVDIISGQGTRLKKKSGVDLIAAPFNLKFKERAVIHECTSSISGGVIRTELFKF